MTDDETTRLYFAVLNEIGIIAQLSRAVMEARLPGGAALPHFAVLNHLVRVRDGRTPLELARAFQVPKATMTHTLSGLAARELIEMRPNASDGRSKEVWLTDAGRKFREDAIAAIAPDVEAISAAFTPDRAASILPHLTALRKVMDDARDATKEASGGA